MPGPRYLTACLYAALVSAACSTGPKPDIQINESPQGAVYLTHVPDGSLQAAHPVKIDSGTIALVLNGILVPEYHPGPKPPSVGSNARPVFSGSQIGYLAPLISEGLKRAASDQQVGFRIGETSTTGLLYAYGRSLYVTLTSYEARPEANRTLLFVPEAAKRPDTYLDPRSTDSTVVVDYELLARLPPVSTPTPAASVPPAPVPAPPQAATPETAEPTGRDAEIDALRKELKEIKKQLAEQEAERARSQRTNPAPHK